jgi:hypothetical protein
VKFFVIISLSAFIISRFIIESNFIIVGLIIAIPFLFYFLKYERIGIYLIFTYVLIDILLAPSLSSFETPGFCLYEGDLKIFYGEVISNIVLLYYLVRRMIKRESHNLRISGVVKIYILLLLALVTISFFVGLEYKTTATFLFIRNVLALSIIFPFLLFFNKKMHIEKFIKYIFLITSIYIILAIISIFWGEQLGWTYQRDIVQGYGIQEAKVVGIIGGDFCVMLILPILLCIAFLRISPRKKILFYILIISGLLLIFIAYQMSAIISLILAIGFYFYFKSKNERKLLIKFLAKVLIIIFFILFFIWGANLFSSLYRGEDVHSCPFISRQDADSGADRMALWKDSITEIMQHPFFGKGTGGEFTRHYIPYYNPHNLFIWLGLNMGLLAPMLVIILLIKFFRFGIKTYRNVDDPFLKIISLVFLSHVFGIIGAGMLSDIFIFWRVNVMFILSVGIVLVIGEMKRRGEIR